MVSLVADDTTLLKDVGLFIEPIEVYDSGGRFLGLFVPANLERGKELYSRAVAQMDWAEIERRAASKEEKVPFEDVRARLQLLEAEMERRKTAGEPPLTPEEGVAFIERLRGQGRAKNNEIPGNGPTAE